MGRANVLKMIYLPRLLYILANSPCKIPKSIFKHIDSICTTFLWKGGSPKVALETLRLPAHLAGLAFPDFFLYYLASQLVHIHDWLCPFPANSCTSTEGAIASSLETLHNIIYRGRVPDCPETSLLATSLSSFRYIVTKVSRHSWLKSPNNPLWFNPNLQELYSLPDPNRW